MTLEVAPIDLYQLIQEMRSLLYVNAEERGLSFVVEQSPELPWRIEVDGGKLRQVLINLIGNAIKYTKQGGVILRATVAKRDTAEKVRLRFEVEDTGPGISEEDRKRIFQPFVQLREQGAIQTGTGLGLAICRQYVDIMGGQIDCFSKKGKGSVFFFEIPAKELPFEENGRYTRAWSRYRAGRRDSHGIVYSLQKINLRTVYCFTRYLSPIGFDIREAVNGKEALEIFEQWHPDLIWMDIRMPVMDGLEATHRIKSTDAGLHTKIVAITAQALEDDRMRSCKRVVMILFESLIVIQKYSMLLSRHLGLRFVYEEKPVIPPKGPEMQLRPEQLTVLPSDLISQLHLAVIGLDPDLIQVLINKIRQHDSAIGRALQKLADRFQYGYLLKLLNEYSKNSGGFNGQK